MKRMSWFHAGLATYVALTLSTFAATWTESFNGTSLDTFWWTPSTADGNTITLTNGHVEMNQVTYNGSAGLTFNFPLAGDFDLQVDYQTHNWDMGGHDQQRMGLGGVGPGGFLAYVQRVSDFWFGGEIYLTYWSGATWNAGTKTTDLHGKLRLARTESTIIGYFWNSSAGAWERAYDASGVPAYTGPFQFSLSIWSGFFGTQVGNVIEFDNVVVNGGGLPDAQFISWTQAAGLSGADALPGATPWGDAVPNLVKYAFNLNGNGPDAHHLVPRTGASGLPTVWRDTGGAASPLCFEYIRRVNGGVVCMAKESTTLAPGSWLPLTGTPTITTIDAEWERVSVAFADTPANTARFLLVEVALR